LALRPGQRRSWPKGEAAEALYGEAIQRLAHSRIAVHAARGRLVYGERARKRTVATREDLTVQDAQIARLARDGLSIPEIGARLFISPRTVEYHLRGLRQARHQLAQRARPRAPARTEHSHGRLMVAFAPAAWPVFVTVGDMTRRSL
jgi:DNA-binding NarL/FixJ family response regulator